MKTLFLVRGVPGCGKTTLVESLNVGLRIAADDYHTDKDDNYNWKPENTKKAHQWCQDKVHEAMQSDNDIAVHNTFTQYSEMEPYFKMAEEYGYRVTTLIVENRHGSKSVHNVPSETIQKMTERFEVILAPEPTYEDYVQIKEQNGLFIHKYKNYVFYNNLWDKHPDLKEARGLVKDKDGNIVQYAFTKIFNRFENNTNINRDHTVLAINKINGFMACVSWYNDDILVSTTGSLESDFVNMAKEILPLNKMKKLLKEYQQASFCFEIVHPDDPHIIPEKVGAYLIGARKKVIGSKQESEYFLNKIAQEWGVFRPNWEYIRFSDLTEKVKDYKREGFVVYDTQTDTVLKIKSPFYLTSKFIARTKDMSKIFDKDYKQKFDEEFYDLCEYLQSQYTKESFSEIPEQDRLTIVRNYFGL